MVFSIVKSSCIIASLMYSHICHRLPIATPCYILLWVNLALAFALMSGAGVVETVYILEFGEQIAENPLFSTVSEDSI